MLIPNHPHDERLSALASGDAESIADSALSEHVASCLRCTDTVAELGALRASLAELPDVRPHRPLQLLPPVTDTAASRVDCVGGWARRFFAPVLTAGAALAMVGLVGTAAPLVGPTAQSDAGSEAVNQAEAAPTDTGEGAGLEYSAGGATVEPRAVNEDASTDRAGAEEPREVEPLQSDGDVAAAPEVTTGSDEVQDTALSERSVWPMVLFAGVAIMIAAALLRWILAPRAA